MFSDDNLQHGRPWKGQDVAGWFACEKLDGRYVQMLWTEAKNKQAEETVLSSILGDAVDETNAFD